MSVSKPLRLVFLGAPGSGKGTQTSRLLKQFPYISPFSSGDILRSQINSGTEIGNRVAENVKSGKLVSDKLMVSLITSQLKDRNLLHENSSWLLDGFPRTKNQAEELDRVLRTTKSCLNLVLELDVDQKKILERIEARWIHASSGRVYNLDYNPPKVPFKDDITGDSLVKRDDDTASVFQQRLDKYNSEIEPLKHYYKERGILTTVSGATSDIIYPKISKLIIDNFL